MDSNTMAKELATLELNMLRLKCTVVAIQIGFIDMGAKILKSDNEYMITEYRNAIKSVSEKMGLFSEMDYDKLKAYAESRQSAIQAVLSTYEKESSGFDT